MGQTVYLGRPHCYRCVRPQLRCLCAAVPQIDNRTPLWVLQHPRERRHPFATVPLLRLALQRLRVDVCWQVAAMARVATDLQAAATTSVAGAWPIASTAELAVLFPSAHAVDLAELPPSRRPRQLILLDGTWSTARSLLRQNPVLQQLPHVRFTPKAPSRYRIRREPQADYTSTLEAALSALALLEPERAAAFAGLLAAFDAMVDGQLTLRAGRHDTRRRLRGRRPTR